MGVSYLNSLREVVGHRPLIMPGATVLVLNEQVELLMIRRSDTGDWGVPGGMMEPGETIEETARRELREETNLDAGELELFGVFSGPQFFIHYPNGDEIFAVPIAYIAHDVHGVLNLADGEHFDFGYFPLSDLPGSVNPSIRPILKQLIERYNVSTFERSNEDQNS
jgi:8-oxo-dGTP pyrophosphatase MutT (NUDIX family)